jgi:hypothetical protein
MLAGKLIPIVHILLKIANQNALLLMNDTHLLVIRDTSPSYSEPNNYLLHTQNLLTNFFTVYYV